MQILGGHSQYKKNEKKEKGSLGPVNSPRQVMGHTRIFVLTHYLEIIMQVMVELHNGTVHSFEELEILGHNPLVIAFMHKEDDEQATIGIVRRFFTRSKR